MSSFIETIYHKRYSRFDINLYLYRLIKMRIQIACSLFYHSCWFNISDIDECLDRTSCGREAQCQNAPGTFRCNCPNGEPFNAITRSCTSAVACTNNNNCPGNAICTNGACNCPEPNVGPDCEGMFHLLSDLLLGVFSYSWVWN